MLILKDKEIMPDAPVILNDRVIGVCTNYQDGICYCEIWDKYVKEELDFATRKITTILLGGD